MNVIFWDTETNGLQKQHSVLSISAIKADIEINENKINSQITDRYERFYFRKPNEKIGIEAINVNGLTDDVIKIERNNANYPEYFYNDINSFHLFCSDTKHFVGHNISFDKKYINFGLKHIFCTMKTNTYIIKLKNANGKIKFPSLNETAHFYEIETNKNELHNSMYDSYIAYQIFCKMLGNEKSKGKVMKFLSKS